MRESEVEAYLVKRVKELGGDTRKMKWIGRRGAPDRFVMLDGGFFVETKAPGAELRPEQEKEIEALRKSGVGVFVADSYESVDRCLVLQAEAYRISSGNWR